MAMQRITTNIEIIGLKEMLDVHGELFEKTPTDNNRYLPLNIEVLAILYNIKAGKAYSASYNDCYPIAVKEILRKWEMTGIPISTYKTVKKRMAQLMDKYRKIKQKIHRGNCHSPDVLFLNELFNISSCTCLNVDLIGLADCKCPLKARISESGLAFLIDQKTERNFTLDSYQFETNTKCSDTKDLQCVDDQHRSRSPEIVPDADVKSNDSESYEEKENGDDIDYFPESHLCVPCKIALPNSLAELNFDPVFIDAVRYDSSYQQVASIVNRTLQVIGAITSEEKGLVVNRSFVQRGVQKIGKRMTNKWNEDNVTNTLQCFFFDGVKAKNLMMLNKHGRMMQDNSVMYENIVVVQQPSDRYLGFIATKECTARAIFSGMRDFFVENEINLSILIAIGSDGASTNTGFSNGIITKFESYLNRPLHWIVCLLHLIDLILRAVVALYYGDTIGPGKYFGRINDDLSNCHTLSIVAFTKVCLKNMPEECSLNSFDYSRLNKDQRLLYTLSQAVSTGKVPDHLADCKPGDLSDPRWTTLASRFLRLFMSTKVPSIKLIGMVHFIQNVYVPCLFWIKCHPDWTEGSRHLYRILSFSRTLPKNVFNAIKNRVTHNSYFAHYENILLSMITDSDTMIRRAGYEIILKTRLAQSHHDLIDNVRVFKKPERLEIQHIEDDAENPIQIDHYSKLINWTEAEIFEPPFTHNLTDDQLKNYMHSDNEIIDVPRIPSHSQATELCVQVVKNIVRKYPGKDVQEQRIKTKLYARSLNSHFKSTQKKAEFQC